VEAADLALDVYSVNMHLIERPAITGCFR
jgi:hypothetical protein